MKTNLAGITLIKRFESFKAKPYLCPAGIPTIGYGHTGDVKIGQRAITEHEADVILASDLERFEEGVAQATRSVQLNANEFSALVSFAFNLGTQALINSTLLKMVMRGDRKRAADEFLVWNKARVGGQLTVLAGLVARRQAERELFLSPVNK